MVRIKGVGVIGLCLAVGCGSNGGSVDAAGVDVPTRASGMITVDAIESVTGSTAGALVNADTVSSLDANGHAEVLVTAGTTISVVFHPLNSPGHAYSLMGVQPGDAIRFGRASLPPTATVHVTLPVVAGAAQYVVHTDCSSATSPTAGVVDVGFCGAASYVYAETVDASGAGIGSFFVDTVASGQSVTAAFQPQVAASVSITGVPSGVSSVPIDARLVTPLGTILDRAATATADGAATLMLPTGMPVGELQLQVQIAGTVVSARRPFTGTPDAIAVDATGNVMPTIDSIVYHEYSYDLSWRETGEAPARTAAAARLVYLGVGEAGGTSIDVLTWDIAGPDVSPIVPPNLGRAKEWGFPVSPVAPGDTITVMCDVDPAGYDDERATLLSDDHFPPDGTTSRSTTSAMTLVMN